MSEDADLEERMSDGDGDGEEELTMVCGRRSASPGAGGAPPLGLAAAKDYTALPLKPDHAARPLWVCPDGRIILETFSPAYRAATDFLVAVAEPVCRPASLHEYALTPHSLYAAVSVGLDAGTVAAVLDRLCKTALPPAVAAFIAACTGNFGKVKLVLKQGRFWVESPHPAILRELLADDVIADARVVREGEEGGGGEACPHPPAAAGGFALITDAPADVAGPAIAADAVQAADDAAAAAAAAEVDGTVRADGEAGGDAGAPPPPAPGPPPPPPPPAPRAPRDLVAFEVDPAKVEHVKARCLPGGLNYPMLEEYDFRADTANPDLEIALRPGVQHRPYQDKAMAKMFGNGRARSGVIVLPCGAGKSLVGITAAARVRKSVLVLVTNNVSVDQWKHQVRMGER
jgi:DNA excision repair protein ERCC-3